MTLEDHIEVKRKVKFSAIKNHEITFSDEKNKIDDKEKIRYRIARRAAKEVTNGMNVNLGIGIPTLLSEVLPPDVHINLQS